MAQDLEKAAALVAHTPATGKLIELSPGRGIQSVLSLGSIAASEPRNVSPTKQQLGANLMESILEREPMSSLVTVAREGEAGSLISAIDMANGNEKQSTNDKQKESERQSTQQEELQTVNGTDMRGS